MTQIPVLISSACAVAAGLPCTLGWGSPQDGQLFTVSKAHLPLTLSRL